MNALELVFSKALEYYQGEETMGVLSMYERSALILGYSIDETELEIKKAKAIVDPYTIITF